MKESFQEYSISSSLAERCLASVGPAHSLFVEYLGKITRDPDLKFDRDFYLHYLARIYNALNDTAVADHLN